MSNFFKVGELIDETFKGITPSYVEKSSVLVLNQKCIRNNRIDFDLAQYHDENKKFSENKELREGDILINSTGQGTAGRCAFVSSLPKNVKVIVDSHILVIRIKNFFTAGCLEYSLYNIENLLQSFIDGSTGQGEFDKFRLFNLSLSLPDPDEREKVYDCLSNIDKKIEVNNRLIEEITQITRVIFDYWFKQYDFPDENNQPYCLSKGKMVFNKIIKEHIPEHWTVGSILEIAELSGGGTPSKKNDEYWNGNIPFFTPSDCGQDIYISNTEDKITKEGLANSSTRLFKPHTVFITARGSVGRLAINSIPMAMNQSCYALSSKKDIGLGLLFFLTKDLIEILKVKATGSVFNSIVTRDIQDTNLVIPDKKTMIKFNKLVDPLFKKMELLHANNLDLKRMRDWLIPLLMSSKITVKDNKVNVVEGAKYTFT
ncbi:restriction endonuclease subunit S [Acinetobacter baumannii]